MSGAAQTASAPARSSTSSVRIDSATSLPSRRPQPDSSTPTRFAMRLGLPRGRRKCPGEDGGPRAPRQLEVVLQVVDAREPVVEELLGAEQVGQVSAAVRRAAFAGAAVLDGAGVVAVLGVGD